MKPASVFVHAPHVPHETSSEHLLRRINFRLGVVVYTHIAGAFISFIMFVLTIVVTTRYYAAVSRVLTPDVVAGGARDAMATLGYVTNITGDVAFMSDGIRYVMTMAPAPAGAPVGGAGGRRLLEAALAAAAAAGAGATGAEVGAVPVVAAPAGGGAGGDELGFAQSAGLSSEEAVQASLTAFLRAATAKMQTLDVNAGADFLRYLMALQWKADVAPRVDNALASIAYGERLAGAALEALASADAQTKGLFMPPPVHNARRREF